MDGFGNIFLLIWTIGLQAIASLASQDETVNVTSGVGLKVIFTLHVIDNDVTWYTANEACPREILGSHFGICGHWCSKYANKKIAEIYKHSDTLLWIGRIKSGDDNNVYYGDGSCDKDSYLTELVENIEGQNDQTRCLAFNTSSQMLTYGIDDCFEKHPYICMNSMKDNNEWEVFYNMSITYDTKNMYQSNTGITSVEECQVQCDWWYPCLFNVFDFNNRLCYNVIDNSSNFDAQYNLSLIAKSSVFNIIRVKPATRAFIKFKSPSVDRTAHEGLEYRCTTPATESSSSTETNTEFSTEEPICYCSCPKQMAANSSELQELLETLKSTLTVDKKVLSSTVRQLTSAGDPRPSSKAFGLISAIILALVVLFIISSDIVSFCLCVKNLINRRYYHGKILN